MSRRPLTPLQDELLDLVSEADAEWREAKAHALERAKEAAEREIEQVRLRRDLRVLAAVEAGVPNRTVFQRGLGTKAHITFARSLENATAHPDSEKEVAGIIGQASESSKMRAPSAYPTPNATNANVASTTAKRDYTLHFDADTNLLTVKLGGATFEAAARDQDWTPEVALEHGFDVATFYVSDLAYFDPATGVDFMPEFGLRQPVVAWARETANEKAILAWLDDNYGDTE